MQERILLSIGGQASISSLERNVIKILRLHSHYFFPKCTTDKRFASSLSIHPDVYICVTSYYKKFFTMDLDLFTSFQHLKPNVSKLYFSQVTEFYSLSIVLEERRSPTGKCHSICSYMFRVIVSPVTGRSILVPLQQ